MDFDEWMNNNTSLSDSSIYKYNTAVKTISKEMMEIGIINKPLMEMELLELELSLTLIFFNEHFLTKDKSGHKMYSNSLKQFKYYYLSSYETSNTVEQGIIDSINNDESLLTTTKQAIINSRVGQGEFRNKLIHKYSKCIVTGVANKNLLIASHIKPWVVSSNEERLSVDNGFLLTPTFDKLFDIGLITFDSNSVMRISQFLGKENENRLNIRTDIAYDLKLNATIINNLQYHNDVIFIR